MPFADFHVHGNFKSYFTGYKVAEKKSPWEKIIYKVDKVLFNEYDELFTSQSCFSQMLKGDLQLAVVPLYSTERGFAASFLLQVLNFLSKNIDNKLFRAINKRQVTHYKQLQDCYAHLLTAYTGGHTDAAKVNFTRTSADFKLGHINVVFSMEGAHAFLDREEDVTTPAGMQKVVERIMDFKKKARDSEYPRLFILNFTHLTRAHFSNHAFGIKLISHEDFIPIGRGLSAAGLKLIETCLMEDDDHHAIVIDIKHMSLESRKEYYKIRNAKYPGVPVVASHAACTGISYEFVNDYVEEINAPQFNKKKCNLVTYRKPDGHIPGTGFNPWSINLYDEDIAEILVSGGIIGLSLDQRILGTGKLAREKMSRAETFEGVTPDRPVLAADPDEGPSIKDAELHFRHFCNNLFHIIKVGKRISGFGDEAWNRVVIGSDFDGLIDAVDFCCTAEDYQSIGVYMKEKMPALAEEAGVHLPMSLQDIIEGLLYTNGEKFLRKYY